MSHPSLRTSLILTAAVALAVAGCGTSAPPKPDKAGFTLGGGGGAGLGTGDLKVASDNECLVNDDGIQAKVLVTKQGTRCLSTPPSGEVVGAPLGFYLPYFIFDVYPKKGPTEFYQIGATTQRSSVVGWVPAASAARWDTRVGARPVAAEPGVPVPPMLVYADKDALVEIIKNRRTDRKPIAKREASAKRPYMPWPIVATERIEVGGQVHELVKINFLAEVKASELNEPEPGEAVVENTPKPPAKDTQKIAIDLAKLRMLDVVFAIDTTGSMGPYIENAKVAVKEISRKLAAGSGDNKPDIALGLVAYRDHEDAAKSYVTKRFDLETNIDRFLTQIDDLKADGGGDLPEAVYDGVHEALTVTSWRDKFATKVVIVIGDASAHEPGDKQNPHNVSKDQLVTEAKDGSRQARIFGLVPEGEDDDKRTLRSQLGYVASSTKGDVLPLKDATQLVDRVLNIVGSQEKFSDNKVRVVAKLDTDKSAGKIAEETGLNVRDVTEVMEFLAGAGIDLKNVKPGEPAFATGWVLCERNGEQVLDREVYLARKEVDLLLMGMNGLLAAGNDPEQAERIFRAGVGGRTNPFAAFFEKKGSDPLDIFLQARGIPVGRTSLLRFTADEIRTMPESKRAELTDRLRRSIVPSLTNAGNNNDLWRSRTGTEFGWIPEAYLP